ncbi:hypothetical protein D3C86_1586090 [compost metagenome]
MIAIVLLLLALRLLAYILGENPNSSAIFKIRSFVLGLISLPSRKARDTVDLDKPKRSANSIIVICDISAEIKAFQIYNKFRSLS